MSRKIIKKLRNAGMEKITFAGGEPLLFKHLLASVKYAKGLGLTTSIITNGSLITDEFLEEVYPSLDWFGLSVDSTCISTNKKIGRYFKNGFDYYNFIMKIKNPKYDFKIKINTVVNKYNQRESLQDFIAYVDPDRWKVFNTLKVRGQNDMHFEEIKSTEFDRFVDRHYHPNMIVEDNELMTSSYVLVDPLGRFFDDTNGVHTYSDSLLKYSVEHCLSQVNLSEEKFIERGGIYNWK